MVYRRLLFVSLFALIFNDAIFAQPREMGNLVIDRIAP